MSPCCSQSGIALKHHDHVLVCRTPAKLGKTHCANSRSAKRNWRVYRVCRSSIRAHGIADLSATQIASWPNIQRNGFNARHRPHRLSRPHRQYSSLMDKNRSRWRDSTFAGWLQRSGWHAHERKYFTRSRRKPRSRNERRVFQGNNFASWPHVATTLNALRNECGLKTRYGASLLDVVFELHFQRVNVFEFAFTAQEM